MNAQDLTAILDGNEPAPAPAPVAPPPYHAAGSLTGCSDEHALSFAAKFGVLNPDGTVRCLRDCGRPGQLPSLLCAPCLAGHRRGWR